MEHVEILASKSAGKQIERSKSGYKPSKIAQKMFADLFVYSPVEFEGLSWQKTVAKPSRQSYNADNNNAKRFPLSTGGKPTVRDGKRF